MHFSLKNVRSLGRREKSVEQIRVNRCTLLELSWKLPSSLLEAPHCVPPACKGWRKGCDISSCQSTPGAIESRLQAVPGWWCDTPWTVENNPSKVNVSAVYVHSISQKYESDLGSWRQLYSWKYGGSHGFCWLQNFLEEEKIIAFMTGYTVPHSCNVCLWNSSCVQNATCNAIGDLNITAAACSKGSYAQVELNSLLTDCRGGWSFGAAQ